MGQEVGDVAQSVAVSAVHVRPIVESVHLMDAYALKSICAGLDRIEDRRRLAVGEGTITSAPGVSRSSTASADTGGEREIIG